MVQQQLLDSTVVTISDPTFEIGQSTQDDNLDRGIKFKYKTDTAKVGFFGMDDTDHTIYLHSRCNRFNSGVFSGAVGTIKANIEGKIGDSNPASGVFTTLYLLQWCILLLVSGLTVVRQHYNCCKYY